MNSNPRQLALLDKVRAQSPISVEQLSEELGVTLQTVRRDVQRLADAGLLTRFHGGVRVPSSTIENIGYLKAALVQHIDLPAGCALMLGNGSDELIALLHWQGCRAQCGVVRNTTLAVPVLRQSLPRWRPMVRRTFSPHRA